MNRHAAWFTRTIVVIAACWASPGSAQDSVTPLLHPLFQDHAVLQRDQPITVWGMPHPVRL